MKTVISFLAGCSLTATLFAQPDLQWAKQLSTSGDINAFCTPLSVAEDAAGNIISVGYFVDSVDLDPGTGTQYEINPAGMGLHTGYIMKQDSLGTLIWGMTIAAEMSRVMEVVTDDSGNIYVTGCFLGTCDFDPGPASYILYGDINFDGFFAKYSPTGSLIWVDEIESQTIDGVSDMAMDDQGNLLLYGRFLGTVDFDPGSATFNLTGAGPYAETYYIAKFTRNDDLLWAGTIAPAASLGAIYINDINVDAFGNVYFCGRYKGSSPTDFDPGPGQAPMIGATNYYGFLVKLNAGGNYVWSKQVGPAGANYSSYDRMEIGPDNMINLLGNFHDTMDLDPGAGTSMYTASQYGESYLCKLDTTGNLIWASLLETGTTNSMCFGLCLAVDEKGWLYITGEFYEGTDFDPGAGVVTFPGFTVHDQVLCAYDSTGALAWARSLGFTEFTWVGDLDVSQGEMNMVGSFTDTMNFATAPGYFPMMAAVATDGYICHYDDLLLGVNEITHNGTTVFPNPTSGAINIHSEKEITALYVYDMMGRLVFTDALQSPVENTTVQLELSAGTYVLKCEDVDGNSSTQRFIVQ